MGARVDLFIKTGRRIFDDPRRIRVYFSRRGLRRIRYLLFMPKHGSWLRGDEWSKRSYSSYADYVAHQSSKLGVFDISEYNEQLAGLIRERCSDLEVGGRPVLCLGARLGGEVQGFLSLGAFAVGVDLNPGPQNRYVLYGDFHDLQFPDRSAFVVFTNSLDHSLYLTTLLEEVARLLAEDGTFVVEATRGDDAFDDWAATTWASVDSLAGVIESCGFQLSGRRTISNPWQGEHLRFRRGKAQPPGID